ncbi:A-kinase anchor protein 9 isoform X3 [Hyperolius riggenbachi]|uniref:A-kinase anchor protein 9 isoform X3 n=1 Tax=Hyperolius riggenbachi TaxID=752182 RepID=UPI0035A2FFFA
MDEEDQERRRKLEAGKAKLAQFRQRKGQTDSQASTKKTKKKKTSSGSKHREQPEEAPEAGLSQSDEAPSQTSPSAASTTAEFAIMRTLPHGEILKHDKTYTIEPESEVSTTADDYTSEVVDDSLQLTENSTADMPWEEEFEVRETFSERGNQSALTRLEVMEDELVGKQQEIEELNRELEDMRAAYGTEGMQQLHIRKTVCRLPSHKAAIFMLQEFETAIKQRDGIITQLTANLQQARKEKDDIMREFLELTEQSQKLKIQFQHLQASETLRSTSHSSTAADLLHSKQHIITYQQQLEERDQQLSLCQKEIEDFQVQVTSLQAQIHNVQQVQQKELELSFEKKLNEKDLVLDDLKSALHDEEIKCLELKERISEADKSVDELREQLTQKSQEISSLSEELNSSRQKERRSSDEIKQLMGTVEDLQRRHYRDSQPEADLVQRMELETQRKLEQLQAELDEMHGQQIVQMKQELVRQHALEIERLLAQHKEEVDAIRSQTAVSTANHQINELNAVIDELNARLQRSDEQRDKMKEDFSHRLEAVSMEKSQLQKQIESLLQDLSFAREQVHKARQSLTDKENKLNEASSLFVSIDDLKAQLAAANEFTKELESKHEAEVTNYKIKLEMLEREKDEVLDRMAESQEAELEKLRTHFLFSQEEELVKLREDLTLEHRTNIENLKDNLEVQYRQKLDQTKHEMGQTITAMQLEKDNLITKQNYLMLEISNLKDLLRNVNDPNSEQMMLQINELQKELDCLRREEKEKGTIEQEVQVLQLKIEMLEMEVKEKETLKEKVASLETDNRLLKDQNDALQNVLKERNLEYCETLTESVSHDHLDLKNKIERLTSENMQLLDLQQKLKEEIELQKNTFSFAEKNFEVNYHELKEDYSCMVNLKEQVEASKAKLEVEYKAKLDALNNELLILKRGAGDGLRSLASGSTNLVKADRSDAGEVVEKDTTELMEKLETAQRDKQELSLKLSSLSEELQLKQNEINQLKEQVKSLCLERDRDKGEGGVLQLEEAPLQSSEDLQVHIERTTRDNLLVSDDLFLDPGSLTEETVRPVAVLSTPLLPEVHSPQKEREEASAERETLLRRLEELTVRLEDESSILGRTRCENEELMQRLDAVLQQQAEDRLQLEAQRISLTHIHKAQIELITEKFQSENQRELDSLRETLLRDQEEMRELRDQQQRELERLQRPQSGIPVHQSSEGGSWEDLAQELMRRIQDECADITQLLLIKEKEEGSSQEESVNLEEITCSSSSIQSIDQRTALQTLHKNLTTLLERYIEEYRQMGNLPHSVGKILQTADLSVNRELPDISQEKQIAIQSCSDAPSQSDVQDGQTLPPLEGAEKLRAEFSQQRAQLEEKHSAEIEHLRSYFQQQLKENEDKFSKELTRLQEQLQDVTAASQPISPFRALCEEETGAELGLEEEAAIFQRVCDKLKEAGEAAQLGDPSAMMSSEPVYQELQSLRHALFSSYIQQISALKKQQRSELEQLRTDLTQKFNAENAALRQEIIQLSSNRHETLNGGFQPTLYPIAEEKSDADLNQLLEERYQEKMEEEVARVIVEMSIAFAQQTELARLSAQEIEEQKECPPDLTEVPDSQTPEQGEGGLTDGQTEELQTEELEQEDSGLQEAPVRDINEVDLVVDQHEDLTLRQEDGSTLTEPQPKERTVILKEEAYNQMVAMGAESAKFRQMYEERVEEMRQELVRQEQEYQQAAEALRLAHAAQLERQVYDQEQLLSEVHQLRAQLAQSSSVISENQATEREKILLEELESMKQTCGGVTSRPPTCSLQDSSSQTQDEAAAQPDTREPGGESGQGDGERGLEESEATVGHPSGDRKSLKRVNNRLVKILLEIAKTTGAVEETIGRHVVGLLDKSSRRPSTCKVLLWNREPEDLQAPSAAAATVTTAADGGDTCSGVKAETTWSEAVEEDLDAPLQLTEAGFPDTGLSPEEESQVFNIRGRLQAAVEKLLEAITETSNQLEHAKAAQTELVRESVKWKQEITDLLQSQEELQERLKEEAKAREHLALELSKAEGLLDGYTDERVFLEKQMQEKSDLVRHLEQELQSTGNRLQELEQERQQIQEERELLSRQKNALKASAAPAEQRIVEAAAHAAPKEELLEETEKLLKEKIEVQRQAEKDSGDLHKQVKMIEVELEEQVSRYTEMELEKNTILEDLRQKNLSLEKQLEKTKRFLDEQAVDREHERDVFQQEIQKLEQQLKTPQRHQPVNDHQSNEMEKLESHLKEKTDKCSELLLCKEQLQRDVQERNEEIEKLESRIRELEQALLLSADTLQKAEDRRASFVGMRGEMPLEAQLQVEREATDRKEKEITNLVEQLEQFREELENKNEEVQQLHMQLEIQRKESATRLQEMEQEIKSYKDELEAPQHEDTFPISLTSLRQGKMEDILASKEQEIELLTEQIGRLQVQLEAATDNKVIEEKNEQIKEYKSQIKCLKSDQECLKKNTEEEIEKLNEVIEKLQEELSSIEQKENVGFTSGLNRFHSADITDEKDFPPPLAEHGDGTIEHTEDTEVIHETVEREEQVSAVPSHVAQRSMQDMVSRLQELQDSVTEKDLNLKQYYDQLTVLKEEVQMLNQVMERLKMDLADKDQKIRDLELQENHLNSANTGSLPPTSSGGTEEILLDNELEVTKTELKQVKEELQKLKTSSEDMIFKELTGARSKEEFESEYIDSIKSLTEALSEKTSQHLAVEALLASVQETSENVIQDLQSRLQNLHEIVLEKESQLEIANQAQLHENQETQRLNEIISHLQQDLMELEQKITVGANDGTKDGEGKRSHKETSTDNPEPTESIEALLAKELEDTKEELAILKEDLKQLRGSKNHIDKTEDLWSVGDDTNAKYGRVEQKTVQAITSPSFAATDEASQTTLQNLEKQLNELKEVVNLKDSELLQYVNQKDLLDKQAKEIDTLNEEIDKLKQELDREGLSSKEILENKELSLETIELGGDELVQAKTELEKAKMELAVLKEELEKLRLAQKNNNVQVESASTESENAKATLMVTDPKQSLMENRADVLASQAVPVSGEETSQVTLHKKESQLQEPQKTVQLKDSELQQYVQQKDLLEQQTKEVERLNEVVKKLQQELASVGSNDKISKEEGKVSSSDADVDSEKLLSEKAELNELLNAQAELEHAWTELAVLKGKLSKLELAQKNDDVSDKNSPREGDLELHVSNLEQALKDKTADLLERQTMLASLKESTQAALHNMESQLQELQKTIQLKDAELLQYLNQNDLISQQKKEISRLNDLIMTYNQNSETASHFKKDLEEIERPREALHENEVLQKTSLEGEELIKAKAELERIKAELTVMTEELTKIKSAQEVDVLQLGHASAKEDTAEEALKISSLEQALREKTADLLASQTMFTSLQETSQDAITSMESQLQELEKVVQLKDAELLEYMNQQNEIIQQTHEIEQLHEVIDFLRKQLEEAEQKTSIKKTKIEGVLSKKEEKELSQQMNGGEMTMKTAEINESDEPSDTPDNMLAQKSNQRVAGGNVSVVEANKDHEDWVVEALRDKTAQLLADQNVFTSVQETMQSTIDHLETQMQELQQVIKEKDMELLLYLDEIETLKEQVKDSSDEHDQLVLTMEDSLREKVAAALVSEAQLKAIQVHTKHIHADDRPSFLEEEARTLPVHAFEPSHQEESDSKLTVLSLQLLELEKQLSDLHEQLQAERDQVSFANQLAAEKEQQLEELQELLKSTRAKQGLINSETQVDVGDVDVLQSADVSEDKAMTDLEYQLQILSEEATATKEELCHYRELSEKLKEELTVKEASLAHLDEDLQEVRKCLSSAEEKLAYYMKREIQEEEMQNTTVVDFPETSRSPEWSSLDRTSSSSQTDKVHSVNNSNQTPQVPKKHIGVQNELEAAQMSSTQEEVAELMDRYTDKIGQMQELHAAEILDMEARHISEADSLRREQYTIVQALNDECNALKAVIAALKSSEGGAADPTLSSSYHFTDAASSDVGTECDWSQGTEVQSLEQLPEGLRGDEDLQAEFIPSKIKDLLRAVHQEGMQVLSLTEATSPEKEPPFKVKSPPWHEEKKMLLETIASLKHLIAQIQINKDLEIHASPEFPVLIPDWRGELLHAIQEVFQKEQDVMMAAFHTQLAALGRSDANALLNQMQHRLQEQGMEQINSMDCIMNADRRSMLLEIQDLRSQLTSLHSAIQPRFLPNAEAGGALFVQPQPSSPSPDLHQQLSSMSTEANELQEQLGSERLLMEEIKNELALTKMELDSNLKQQHKHFTELESLRMELKKKREELDSLNAELENQQKKCRELQHSLEKEQTKREQKELREREELEDLQILLEEQKMKTVEISTQLEEEKQLVKDLQQQVASRESTYEAELSQERSRVLELQVFLEAEKARSAELSNALEYRQGLEAHGQNTEVDGQSEGQTPSQDLLKELQGQLDSKHSRIVELVSEVEGYKLECVQLRQSLEEERQSLRKELEAEQEAYRLAVKQVEELTAEAEDLQQQVQDGAAEIRRHQADERHLRDTIQRLQHEAQKKESRTEQRDPADSSTTRRSSPVRERSAAQLQTGSAPNILCPDPLSVVNGDLTTEGASFSIDGIRQRLQLVATKLRQLATKANQRVLFEKSDDEDLAWSRNSIQDVLSQLDHVAVLSLQGQNLVLPPGISGSTLTEKLLTQNAELTGYVSRLTEEKTDLQNSMLRLEGELSRYRARGPSGDYSSVDNSLNTEALVAAEREAWSREKLNLHKSLKQAEAELAKVRAELQSEVMQRDLGRDSDSMTLKRVYGKYLRSESFRKALVYQKKYLLLLLGGFQECEEATLALIARMGGQPTYTDLEVITNHSRAFTRFRSAARVAIAISRMRFLVRRWQRATVSTMTNRNSCGQITGNEVRTDSAHHPGRSSDLYGEQRISSCRSQSGFNSPQSTVNSRYLSASDGSPCSHLQHYDPDRALADYITRLEALQKRLGNVPSGSSANNTTHYSIRR